MKHSRLDDVAGVVAILAICYFGAHTAVAASSDLETILLSIVTIAIATATGALLFGLVDE